VVTNGRKTTHPFTQQDRYVLGNEIGRRQVEPAVAVEFRTSASGSVPTAKAPRSERGRLPAEKHRHVSRAVVGNRQVERPRR